MHRQKLPRAESSKCSKKEQKSALLHVGASGVGVYAVPPHFRRNCNNKASGIKKGLDPRPRSPLSPQLGGLAARPPTTKRIADPVKYISIRFSLRLSKRDHQMSMNGHAKISSVLGVSPDPHDELPV